MKVCVGCIFVRFLALALSLFPLAVTLTPARSNDTGAVGVNPLTRTLTVNDSCLSPGTPYSITNQPPQTCPFYSRNPYSITPWPLPIDIAGQRAMEQPSGGDSMAKTAWLSGGTLTELRADALSYINFATPGTDDGGRALYIDSSTSDYYFNVMLSSGHATGPSFRAPQPAWHTTIGRSGGQGDGSIEILDASDTPPRYVIAANYWNHTSPPCNTGKANPACTSGISSARLPAGTTLNLGGIESGEAKNVFTDQDWGTPNGWRNGEGAEGSAGLAPMALIIRSVELENGLIPHAIMVLVDCDGLFTGSGYTNATHVFPSLYDTYLCSALSGNPGGYPPQGAHLYLDYTAAQIAAMSIPNYAKTIITALSVYGGYFTISAKDQGTSISGYESSQSGLPYQVQTGGAVIPCSHGSVTGWCVSGGRADPLFNFLAGQGVPCNGGSGTSTCKYPTFFWSRIGSSFTGPTCSVAPCPISVHWHMADPCVASGLAGGAVGFPASPFPAPRACVGGIYVTIAGTGAGTISSSPSGIITVGSIARISALNGTSITLTASPSAGHMFSGWSGACSGVSTCVLTVNGTPRGTMPGTKIVTAMFN
jgi:hypothetical protein